MSNLVRCGGCRDYKDREGMSKQGLGYLCGPECLELVKERARARHVRRAAAPKNVRATPMGSDIRRRVRTRDGNACRWCGSTNDLQVHHVRYRSEGGGNVMGNLLTLCLTHHAQAHSSKRVWQPVLLAVLTKQEAGVFVTVLEMKRLLECP